MAKKTYLDIAKELGPVGTAAKIKALEADRAKQPTDSVSRTLPHDVQLKGFRAAAKVLGYPLHETPNWMKQSHAVSGQHGKTYYEMAKELGSAGTAAKIKEYKAERAQGSTAGKIKDYKAERARKYDSINEAEVKRSTQSWRVVLLVYPFKHLPFKSNREVVNTVGATVEDVVTNLTKAFQGKGYHKVKIMSVTNIGTGKQYHVEKEL